MATFDGWEEQLFGGYPRLGESCLAHSRTRGSKNGVRRYQTASGEWTPLGLQRRKEREGWGDGRRARREARREQRAAIRESKQRQRSADKEAQNKQRVERKAAIQEERRKNNVKTMTDEELKAKLERAKMEAEYREITKSTARRVGERMLNKYFEEKAAKEERAKLNLIPAVQAGSIVLAASVRNPHGIHMITFCDNVCQCLMAYNVYSRFRGTGNTDLCRTGLILNLVGFPE